MKIKSKTKVSFGIVFILVLSSCGSLFACTSFAVYFDKPFYGMNFDYDPSVEMKFCIDTIGDLKVFDMRFDLGEFFASTVAMNSNGLFCNLQELYPEVPPENPGLNEMRIEELFFESANTFRSCEDVRNVLSDYGVVMGTISLHSLYADMKEAMVVEVGQNNNEIIEMKRNFAVMTNFPVSEFADKNYQEVHGAGDDRYKAAYTYLLEHEEFDLDDGFALLERAVSQSEYYPTRCSLVFDPENTDIYVVLEGNFDKIWKISMENETVETFRGFNGYHVMDIGEGLTASQLKALEHEWAENGSGMWIYVLAVIVMVGILVGLYKKRSSLLR